MGHDTVIAMPRLSALLLTLGLLPVSAIAQQSQEGVLPKFRLHDLSIVSEPAGANVFINGTFCCTTPVVTKLQPWEYRVTLSLTGYQVWEQMITVAIGKGAPEVKAKLLPLPIEVEPVEVESYRRGNSTDGEQPGVTGSKSTRSISEPGKDVYVHGYTRKDGTHVAPYTRSAPGTKK